MQRYLHQSMMEVFFKQFQLIHRKNMAYKNTGSALRIHRPKSFKIPRNFIHAPPSAFGFDMAQIALSKRLIVNSLCTNGMWNESSAKNKKHCFRSAFMVETRGLEPFLNALQSQ